MSSLTPATGISPYCTVTQFLQRIDQRVVLELLSDDEVPISAGSLSTDAKLAALLTDASGMVESAATVGQAYVIDMINPPYRNDLADLVGNSKELLAGMVAHIAIWLLWNRRPNLLTPNQIPPLCNFYMEWVEKLRRGERVFGWAELQKAAQVSDTVESASDVESRRGVVVEASRFFSRRNNRLHG